jgi:hypothetical protein
MDALDDLSLFQLRLGHATNAVCTEVCVASLDASQAAEVLVSGLFPFGYQVGVCYAFSQAIFVEFSGNNLASVEHVVNIAGFLVVNLEDGPE